MRSLGKNYSQMKIYNNNILSQPKAGVLWLVPSKEPLSHRTQRRYLNRSSASNAMETIYYFLIHIFNAKDSLSLKILLDFNSVTFVKQCVRKLPRFCQATCPSGIDLVNLSSTCIQFFRHMVLLLYFPSKFCLLRQMLQISP